MKKLCLLTKISYLIILISISQNSYGADFNIARGDTTALLKALITANKNKETDVINLASNSVYSLNKIVYTSSNKNTTGNASERGLPTILNEMDGLDLTINGNGATIMRATDAPKFGIFDIAGQTLINDLTIRNGNVDAQGAAIFVEFKGNLELYNCKFYDNVSTLDAEGGGGAIYTKSLSVLRVASCYFENNSALNQGGAISNLLSNLYVTDCTFKNNRTDNKAGKGDAGGAIYDDGARGDNGEIIITNCSFENNLCIGGLGGAMFLFPYNKTSVEVSQCTFKNNEADQGGAYWHSGGTVIIRDPDYPHTYAPNTDAHTLILSNCILDGNNASSNGGAFSLHKGKLLSPISNCTFNNNRSDLGGAIFLSNKLPLTISSSTFSKNVADQSGAIAIIPQDTSARVDLINCTFDSNIANQYGGAISVPQNKTPVNITNCTFANNQANNPGNGQSGAIHSGTNTPKNQSVSIQNNLFYNNTVTNPWNTWKHCNCELNDGGNNIFFPENVNGRCVANPKIVDPQIGLLQDNGGTTPTIALLSGSPAIDAGKGCPDYDQRGAKRVGACDVGAFEFNGVATDLDKAIFIKNSLSVYPNPTETGACIISIPQNLLGKEIEIFIYNNQGIMIKTLKTIDTNLDIDINLGKISKGLHLIELKHDKDIYYTKIIAI
ncbi:MAG TPA: choice-of-anchor Q domain-containing protein [Cytophagaceae bacterium]|jgi:predicted outer membrane repeat protein